MRQKLLLLVMLFTLGALNAQDTIWTVIISEARIDRADHWYIELTNIGTEAVDLGNYELMSAAPWNNLTPEAGPHYPIAEPNCPSDRKFLLGDVLNQMHGSSSLMLPAGESFIITVEHDYHIDKHNYDVANFGWSRDYGQGWVTKPQLSAMADIQIHRPENPESAFAAWDSVSSFQSISGSWNGRDAVFLRHYPSGYGGADSCVVDQVGGTFDGDNPRQNPNGGKNVAGVNGATSNHTLVRRNVGVVTKGNRNFITGNSILESEWIPIPTQREGGDTYETWQNLFWTAGNHANTVLDETTLTSSTINIDWDATTMTVPWGVRDDDSIMGQFDYMPGLAWHYNYGYTDLHENRYDPSTSVATGDTLVIYAVGGDGLDKIAWHIIAAPAPANLAMVVPKRRMNNNFSFGHGPVYQVTHNAAALDTIYEIPYALRTDTLLKYLEMPDGATTAFTWVDGNERTDLKEGDILTVTSSDASSTKDYYLKLRKHRKNRNANLSSITWPDIPEFYKGLFGWTGDTIPEFSRAKTQYRIVIPPTVEGVPALVAKNEDDKATHMVKRATNMNGTVGDRTYTITSYAEDDTSMMVYDILLEKQVNPDDIQPWTAEPFISQFTWKSEYARKNMLELVNPGTKGFDISNYMIAVGSYTDPVDAITFGGGENDYSNRYQKYIPGYLWKDPAVEAQHSLVELDPNVSTWVVGGDVFVIGEINEDLGGYEFGDQIDVCFRHMASDPGYTGRSFNDWGHHTIFLFKIVNNVDNIKNGVVQANNPEDFELIDCFGMADGTIWKPIGDESTDQVTTWTRKPHIWKGNAELGGSFADNRDDSEWIQVQESELQRKYGWPQWRTLLPEGTGSHFMDAVTVYRSTITSPVYTVSTGYSMEETVGGVSAGTTVQDFLSYIIKANEGQTLAVVELATGDTLELTDQVLDGDTLSVTSSNMQYTSKYVIGVAALSADATITSSTYTVTDDAAAGTGTIEGMDYGTTIKTVMNNVTPAAGASYILVNSMDEPVNLITLNFDTAYVDVTVTEDVFIEVVAESRLDTMLYQIVPNADASSAFVVSDVFEVNQSTKEIDKIPEGLTVESFLGNLTPAPGASMQMYDKLSYARNEGFMSLDDVLQVSSQDGSVTVSYTLLVMSDFANSLAYVTSTVYTVDAVAKTITGDIYDNMTVADFTANLTPSEGASMVVKDYDGTDKAAADLMANGDEVWVTAANGVTINVYSVEVMVGIEGLNGNMISVFPNPTSGMLSIEGAAYGSTIRVYNAQGATVIERSVMDTLETISLDGQSAGMYFVTISDGNEVTGQCKVLKY